MKKILMVAALAILSTAAFAQKFAHVNLSEVIQLMPEYLDAQKVMMASSKETQETYQAMVDEFNGKYSTYQQKASTWTATIRESKEKELSDMQQRIQEFQQSASQELETQQNQLMAPIQQKAVETINKIAKEGSYIYVFDAGAFIYKDDTQSVDLTPAARKALNIAEGRTLETLQAELQALQSAE
jgi:outer membrane protein